MGLGDGPIVQIIVEGMKEMERLSTIKGNCKGRKTFFRAEFPPLYPIKKYNDEAEYPTSHISYNVNKCLVNISQSVPVVCRLHRMKRPRTTTFP